MKMNKDKKPYTWEVKKKEITDKDLDKPIFFGGRDIHEIITPSFYRVYKMEVEMGKLIDKRNKYLDEMDRKIKRLSDRYHDSRGSIQYEDLTDEEREEFNYLKSNSLSILDKCFKVVFSLEVGIGVLSGHADLIIIQNFFENIIGVEVVKFLSRKDGRKVLSIEW